MLKIVGPNKTSTFSARAKDVGRLNGDAGIQHFLAAVNATIGVVTDVDVLLALKGKDSLGLADLSVRQTG